MTSDELRERRKALNLTQEQLARRLGMTLNSVSRWEGGKVSIPALLDLALKQLESEIQKKK